jgi:hypothetical protein
MPKWQRFKAQEEVLNMAHLVKIVSMGGTITELYENENEPMRGISAKLPVKTHERLEIIAKSIPGMTKEKLVRFMVDSAIFEYCKTYMDNTLFPPEEEETNTAESLIDEAIMQIKSEV